MSVPVAGDGACLFRSFAYFQGGNDENLHLDVRQTTVDYMKKNPDKYKWSIDFEKEKVENWDEYINKLELAKTWADHPVISALALSHKKYIELYIEDKNKSKQINLDTQWLPFNPNAFRANDESTIIRILYRNGNHYDPLIVLKNNTERESSTSKQSENRRSTRISNKTQSD
jgi:hypothetical protein